LRASAWVLASDRFGDPLILLPPTPDERSAMKGVVSSGALLTIALATLRSSGEAEEREGA
jgi:hypothetical protein